MPVSPTSSRGTFLTSVATLTHAQILTLPTTPVAVIPPTQILNYAAQPASLPYPVWAAGWMLAHNGTPYTNQNVALQLLLVHGSDWSSTVALVAEWNVTPNPPAFQLATLGFTGTSSPVTFVVGNNPESGNGYQDNGLYVAMNNKGDGNIVGGDAADTLTVEVVYRVSTRPT